MLVDADDGVQRGVDDRLQPSLAGIKLLVALLQRLALGKQRALIDNGTQILPGGWTVLLGHDHAGHMQVAAELEFFGDLEQNLVYLGASQRFGLLEGRGHALCVVDMHKGLEVDQQPVFFGGLKSAVSHGIGLDHHIVFINHQQR